MLVVDPSLAVELALDRVGSQTRESLGDDLVAPPLLWSGAASVLNELAYRGEVTRELANRAFDRFLGGKVGISE